MPSDPTSSDPTSSDPTGSDPTNGVSAADIRKFAYIQSAITVAFLAFVFWMFGGIDGDYPPVWLVVVLMICVAVGAFFSERVWLVGPPLDPDEGADTNEARALEIFAAQTIRKLIYTEIPLLIAVLACFVGSYAAWPVFITAIPGLLVQAWETWPHARNTSMSEVILDSKGATSRLLDSFDGR